MKRQELIDTNPLRLISPVGGGVVPGRHLALVKAPVGTGKTSILVQIALDKLLRGEHVVHVGINDQLHNIKLWYIQVFSSLARGVGLTDPAKLENEVMDYRLLMTFMAENFSPSRLIERLQGLGSHDIALPDCLVIDGLKTGDSQLLGELKAFAAENNITIWLSWLDGQAEAESQADTILELQTSSEGISSLVVVRDGAGYAQEGASLHLDSRSLTLYR